MAYNVNRNSLENHWMPFTDNRGFKANPRLISQASGVYMDNHMGSKVLDGSSGLFAVLQDIAIQNYRSSSRTDEG